MRRLGAHSEIWMTSCGVGDATIFNLTTFAPAYKSWSRGAVMSAAALIGATARRKRK